jgi:hypothetical protein
MRPPANKLATSDVMKTVFPDLAKPVTPNRMGAPNTVSVTFWPAAWTVSITLWPICDIIFLSFVLSP